MKVITAAEFEQNFDAIIDDVAENHTHYKITLEGGRAVVLVPHQEYECLINTYEDWVNECSVNTEELF